MILNTIDIQSLEQRYRTTFINSLAGFRQAVLVGTMSEAGNSNLALFNSLIHLGASPALFGLISRPDSVPRDTLRNILHAGEYTLNYIHTSHYKKAHQTSARYESHISEFEKAGFKEQYIPTCSAPFVDEAIVKIAMNFEQCIDIPLNGAKLIIGSIKSIEIADTLVNTDGFIDLSAAEALICQGLDAYFSVQHIGRLPYAKP